MKSLLNKWEKILSIAGSLFVILSSASTFVFKPEWFEPSVIIAIAFLSIVCCYLVIRLFIQARKIKHQSSQINELSKQREAIRAELDNKEARIALLEKLMNVPFFKKWNLIYTFMWRNSLSILSNPVNLFEIHVSRRLKGTGQLKDNNLSYIFSGECLERMSSFRFCIAGLGSIPLKKINFKVIDHTWDNSLEFGVAKNSEDSDIKFAEIYFRNELQKGDVFKIELTWQWPKTAYCKSDYFSLANIYSISTKRLVLDLYPTEDMKLSTVETYKFGISDKEPVRVNHIYMNDAGYYHTIIDNPEKDADYITYYES